MKWLTKFLAEKELLRSENALLTATNAALEVEIFELQRDNRLLVNAQLKQAGVVSLPDLEPHAPAAPRMRKLTLHQRQQMHAYLTDPARKLEAKNGEVKS